MWYIFASGGTGATGGFAEQLGINWQAFLASVVNFAIVMFLLHRFAYKPILRILEERRMRIAEGIENAERMRAELTKAQEKAKEIIAEAAQQAQKIIDEAKQTANKYRTQEIARATKEAEMIVARAREATRAEYTRMLEELSRDIGSLVVETTAKVVGRTLTPEDHKRLIEEAIANLTRNRS
jgi:F-type H+-transporting ATPase subunit b